MTLKEKQARIREIGSQLKDLPKGKIFYKTIKGKQQPYLQWYENGSTISRYVKVAEREDIFAQLEQRDRLLEELAAIRDLPDETGSTIEELDFNTNVIYGSSLNSLISSVKKYQRRDCYGRLQNYLRSDVTGKVCILYGLRRTGKTTLLFQLLNDLSDEERERAAYIKLRVSDNIAYLNEDLRKLRSLGYKYVFLDEVTLMEDFIDSASILSDIYAMQGMKIMLSGTDSLGFWMAEENELYDRAYMIHTTYIPFHEYSRLLGINDIDEYIRYGGTLIPGETNFDDPDALDDTAAFRDDESTRRYIDTAVCKNIQHSLECFNRGNHFRHLIDLYDADELTGAINRIIESMNHQFLVRTLVEDFKSHDLGSARQMLQKRQDSDTQTDILEKIDKDAVTHRLMEMLEIRNREDQKIGITQDHIVEIKEYLKGLDLIIDCPSESTVPDSGGSEYVLFAQPGMRYCQAQALVHILVNDTIFQSFSEREKKLASDKILEDVRGRMLEDIVLLECSRSLGRNKRAFKLMLSRKEIDMLIYDSQTNTCEEYEIKHSRERAVQQKQALLDTDLSNEVEAKYGSIVRKCVVYRGEDCSDGEVEYLNAEEFLKSMKGR